MPLPVDFGARADGWVLHAFISYVLGSGADACARCFGWPDDPRHLTPQKGHYMIKQVFTFGSGQTCPYTGVDLMDHYATVVAPDLQQCRALMVAVFGQTWSWQYDSADAATRGGQYPMAEHMRLTVGATPAGHGAGSLPHSYVPELCGDDCDNRQCPAGEMHDRCTDACTTTQQTPTPNPAPGNGKEPTT